MSRFDPFPQLKTERLVLRSLEAGDIDRLFTLRSDAENRRFLEGPDEQSKDDTLAFIQQVQDGIAQDQWVLWAIQTHEYPDLIGTICLWRFTGDNTAEVGYELLPDAQGRGYMKEAVDGVVAYGFGSLHLAEIHAFTNARNRASRRLLERCGFALREIIQQVEASKPLYAESTLYVLESPF